MTTFSQHETDKMAAEEVRLAARGLSSAIADARKAGLEVELKVFTSEVFGAPSRTLVDVTVSRRL